MSGPELPRVGGRPIPTELLIGGDRVAAADRFPVIDPATGAVLAEVASGSPADMIMAVDAAAASGPDWAATTPRHRSEALRRAYELMVEAADDVARLIVLENGKTIADARAEVAYAAEFFRWYAEEAVRLDGSLGRAPSSGNRILVTHQPIGVSLLVTPWNFPAAMATRKIGPALAAGCSVVLKPASDTPLTALAIGELLRAAGVPDGVVNVVPSRRAGAVSSAALRDPRVRKLSFTGSTEVGRLLLREAAEQIVSCSMELGGNAPFLVFDDADLDAAVDGAMLAKMRNGGQACTAANRFYVQRAVADEFVSRLSTAMGRLRMGSGLDPEVALGPLINSSAREKVGELVEATVDAGARLRAGGRAPGGDGFFYPATVLADVPGGAPVLAEEIFGPVAPVVAVETEEEAIALANATEYGLVAYLYTGNLSRGLRLAEALETGMVGLNQGLVSEPAAPFGGVKQSGLGREGGHAGIEEFMEPKYVAVAW
ncbi:NAD-dependent succinate-semialdehyde dehydrogenase [Solwaraspora sp. WMMD1047]|uniref:NAD-dependent succinate-semialdehyde dehydrogenase n=1 Tax=Solwaraspora sp. WMMD1047 TaxID=3016102 RepID=UPI002416CDB9|nr:NAD-dependent succinate-semialdehyde dehydrogenase [Solwaraspora sp. WMMD1047]MDG4830564.1 NAD-dependent succinate-semialdehyde dehydrogenase [Solwaraspora sp. WMMD1047]